MLLLGQIFKVKINLKFYGFLNFKIFLDLVLGQRFLNSRLSPVHSREFRFGHKQITWSESQIKILNDLMDEASALIDMFDQVAMLLGPDIKLHNVSGIEGSHFMLKLTYNFF
jgi:hypothetical protein